MTESSRHQAAVEAIAHLAEQIARTSPESAEMAMQIVKLLDDLDAVSPDRDSIQDAIETEAVSDMSDLQLRNATEAVLRTLRSKR
jgi:hypothetical protein